MGRNRLFSTVFVLALTLALGTSVYASTSWNPAGNGIYPPATGDYRRDTRLDVAVVDV